MADPRPVEEQLTDLYLTCFTRYATDEELETVSDYIATRSDSDKNKQQAYYDVVWALLNAKKFSFRH
jgi:hypothetical protein